MKTIELKWIEDDDHVVAEDAYTGLKELIDTGVFPNLEVKCVDDTLYITGDKSDLDKAVMKIQKAYAKYGQIMIKEAKNGVNQELRIESFDENVQDIFNHTLDDYNKFKSSKERPLNYVKQLNDYRFKFKKFYETASRSDKKLLKPYLEEISNLLDESEFMPKIKPIKAKLEEDTMIEMAKDICEAAGKKVVNLENVDTLDDVEKELQALGYNEFQSKDLVKEYIKMARRKLSSGECAMNVAIDIDETYMNESDDNELTKHFGNLKNWGIVEMNESFLSPGELKKKLQRVASRWASIQGVTFEEAYNELRKKKSVKDMLDFYSVDEIIDDLKKHKKEVDDELEDEI